MKFYPSDCERPAEVWDVLENKPITGVLFVDIDAGTVVTPLRDGKGEIVIHCDNIALKPIGFQAIHRWPPTGKPHLFNCYYRKP